MLLMTLIFLEIFSFYVILTVFTENFSLLSLDSNLIALILFCIFVIEGVIGLSGILILVSFRGSDYVGSSFVTKL
jgi:hypothetical protein